MVDAKALKIGALVVGSLLLLFVAGAVLRFVTRILTWAVLAALAVGAGYAAYQLYKGWRAAGEGGETETNAETTVDAGTDVESVQERYARGELSETELEAELEDAVADDDGTAELDRELERET